MQVLTVSIKVCSWRVFGLKLDFEKAIMRSNYSVLPLSIQEVLKNMEAVSIFF